MNFPRMLYFTASPETPAGFPGFPAKPEKTADPLRHKQLQHGDLLHEAGKAPGTEVLGDLYDKIPQCRADTGVCL
jgi:hypothetical protein